MSKKFVLILALLLTSSTVIAAPSNSNKGAKKPEAPAVVELDKNTMYYPNANINSAMNKYKKGNYTGCLQELFSLTMNDPSNALAYYYMAMAYTHLDMNNEAQEAYERVIALSSNEFLTEYATRGRDCLIGGPACVEEVVKETAESIQEEVKEENEFDKFVNSPYGDGMSEEMSEIVKKQELSKFKKTINKKEILPPEDIQKIRDFDAKNSHKSSNDDDTVKIAQVSDEDILQAVQTLKEAGLTLNVQSADNPYAMMYQDPKMAEVSMLLGNNNNNYYNNNSMMNMLPFLMSQAKNGHNIDPRFMQTMMMNSMMSDLNFNNNNNRY